MKKTDRITIRVDPQVKEKIDKNPLNARELVTIGLYQSEHKTCNLEMLIFLDTTIRRYEKEIKYLKETKNKLVDEKKKLEQVDDTVFEEAMLSIKGELTSRMIRREKGIPTPRLSKQQFEDLCRKEHLSSEYVYTQLNDELRNELDM